MKRKLISVRDLRLYWVRLLGNVTQLQVGIHCIYSYTPERQPPSRREVSVLDLSLRGSIE